MQYNKSSLYKSANNTLNWKPVQANPSYRICILNEPIRVKLDVVPVKTYFYKFEILEDNLYGNLIEQVNKAVRPFDFSCEYQWQQKNEDMKRDTIYHLNLTLECRYLIRREYDLSVSAKFFVTDYEILSTFK